MNQIKQNVQQTFNDSAEKFDEIGTPFFTLFGKKLVNFSNIKNDYNALDMACGKAAVTIPAAQKLSKGNIIGIDISDKMIDQSSQKTKKLQLKNATLKVMDAENLEFDENMFDLVFCGFGLFFLPDVLKSLSEVKRVLKPEKELVFSTWNGAQRISWFYEILTKYVPGYGKRNFSTNENIVKEDFSSSEGLEKVMSMAGFKRQETIEVNVDCYYTDVDEWLSNYWNTGVRAAFIQMSKKEYTNFREDIIKASKPFMENGKLKIVMAALFTRAVAV